MVVLGVLAATAGVPDRHDPRHAGPRPPAAAGSWPRRPWWSRAARSPAGLVGSIGAFLVTQPILRHRGVRPPAYLYRSLVETDVLRAVVGTAVVLALLAVFAFATGMLLRRSILRDARW